MSRMCCCLSLSPLAPARTQRVSAARAARPVAPAGPTPDFVQRSPRAAAAARTQQQQQQVDMQRWSPRAKKIPPPRQRRCPSTAALSLMVKVGKMFVCIETVGRVARRAIAAAGSVASRVRAMVLRIFYFC